MAKKSGLSQEIYVHGYDLSGDVGSLERVAGPHPATEVTGINKAAVERVHLRADGSIDFSTWFDDATALAHAALSPLPTTDVVILWALGGAVGDVAAGLVAKQLNYDWNEGPDGSLSGTVRTVGTAGSPLEWLEMLTAGQQTDSSSANGTSKDDTASTSNGIIAYLAITVIGSGTPTVTIEDSANNSIWATLLSFTQVADGGEPTGERMTATGTVDRYLRIATTGTFTDLDFAVGYRRGESTDDVSLA